VIVSCRRSPCLGRRAGPTTAAAGERIGSRSSIQGRLRCTRRAGIAQAIELPERLGCGLGVIEIGRGAAENRMGDRRLALLALPLARRTTLQCRRKVWWTRPGGWACPLRRVGGARRLRIVGNDRTREFGRLKRREGSERARFVARLIGTVARFGRHEIDYLGVGRCLERICTGCETSTGLLVGQKHQIRRGRGRDGAARTRKGLGEGDGASVLMRTPPRLLGSRD
jgi:hypothetical protein